MPDNKKRAVFLDRDGVLIDLKNYSTDKKLDYLLKKEDIHLINGAVDSIKLLNKNNFKVIVVTNMSQVARGFISEDEANSLNEEVKKIFAEQGAIIDAVYFCPHHPNGLIENYSTKCSCRKPLPGMLLQAARDHSINLNQSYIIGDRISDIKAGSLAGCRTIGVKTGYACNDGFNDATPDLMSENVLEAVQLILNENKLKLFINAGGKGERLYPLTKDIPKPLVNVNGKPILHHLVDWAKKNLVSEVIMMNGYKSEKIIEYFGNGENFGISIKHSNEPFPLGSGGPIKFAAKHVSGTFAYISGDLICDVNLSKMLEFHKKNNADITILLHESSHPEDSDILQINENYEITKFISKHDSHINSGNLGNAGLIIMEPKVLDLIDSEVFNLENYLYPKLINQGFKIMGYVSNELIMDIGTPERLKKIDGLTIRLESSKSENKLLTSITHHNSNKKIIRSRAPSRIEFAGGGTDLPDYFKRRGGFVINATINKYSYVSLQDFEDGIKINIENKNALEFPNLKSVKCEGDFDIVKAIIKKLNIMNKEFCLRNDVPQDSGLGTNASIAVSVLGAVHKSKNLLLSKQEIAEEAYLISSKELNLSGGKQNHFASSFGGINALEFKQDGQTSITKLNISRETLRELEKHLILVYVGRRMNTNDLLINQEKEISEEEKIALLDQIKNIAIEMKTCLEKGDLFCFAKCMEKDWMTKKSFSPQATNSYIDHLYDVAKKNGAVGGRVIGAGGGGHMLFYAYPNKEQHLTKKLQENGATIVDFSFDTNGLEVWSVEND